MRRRSFAWWQALLFGWLAVLIVGTPAEAAQYAEGSQPSQSSKSGKSAE